MATAQPRKALVAIVLGKTFTFPRIDVPLEEVLLDDTNTRFGLGVKLETQEAIAKRLDVEEETLALANSIKQNGGLINPIVVSQKNLLLEHKRKALNGNRRTRAFQRLRKIAVTEDAKSKDWAVIAAYERPANMDDMHFDAYLAQEHGDAGTRQHSSYAKASYAYKMHHNHLMDEDNVCKLVGVHSPSALKNMMKAIEIANSHPVSAKGGKDGEARRPDEVYAMYHEMIKKPGGKSAKAYKLMQRSINAGAVWTSKQSKVVASIAKTPPVRDKYIEALRVEPDRAIEVAVALLHKEAPVSLEGVWGTTGRLISQIKKAPRAELEYLDDPKSEQTKTFKKLFGALLELAGDHEHLIGYLTDTITHQSGSSRADAEIGE